MKIPFSVYDFFGLLTAGFMILAAWDYATSSGAILNADLTVEMGLFWIVAAYIIGHVNASFSSAVFEKFAVSRLIGWPNQILLGERAPWLIRLLFPSYSKPLPSGVLTRIRATAEKRGVEAKGEVFFHHARTLAKSHAQTWGKTETFLTQYGFCRNTSFALLVAAAIVLVNSPPRGNALWPVAAIGSVLGVCLFYRYLKFLRQYSYECFTAYPDLASQG